MNLDDLDLIHALDKQNMLGEIEHLPAQLEKAWELSRTFELPKTSEVRRVLIAGMGGSAIGADLLAAYAAPLCRVPVVVHRDYGLPAWARGAETLVIASSHSGNTEETLDSFEAARQAGCTLLAVCTGGELERRAKSAGAPVWKFDHRGQPRAAVGYSFGLLLAAFARLGLVPDPERELRDAAAGMRSAQEALRAETPAARNPAKRMAGQLVGRWVNVYGSGILAPAARRWKGQINELAKAGAGFEMLPEADHNALAGLENPGVLMQTVAIFLRAPSDHPRNRLRADLTRRAFLMQGMNTDVYEARGETRLAQMWTTLHFGDYTAFYLAVAYGMDPSDTSMLEEFKAEMKSAK